MGDDKRRFYDDYEPAPNVSKSLNEREQDYNLSAPYRDMLGILESEEAWSEEDALDKTTVKNKLSDWDENERERKATPPETKRTVRNQLDDLCNDYHHLALVTKKDGVNKYYKLPDKNIKPPFIRKLATYGTKTAEPIEKLLYGHDLIVISVFGYIVGSILQYIHHFGFIVMVASVVSFIFGHYMHYRGQTLF